MAAENAIKRQANNDAMRKKNVSATEEADALAKKLKYTSLKDQEYAL
jgi:hypothetical protein